MKKTIFLSLAALLLILVGCNEKKLLGDVEGTWGVKQYLFESKDKTADFNKQKPQFRWIFNADIIAPPSRHTLQQRTFLRCQSSHDIFRSIDKRRIFVI